MIPGEVIFSPTAQGMLWSYQWVADGDQAEFVIDTRASANESAPVPAPQSRARSRVPEPANASFCRML